MSRPAKFDRSEVCKSTMLLFWQQGFNDTTIQNIQQATGLTASSLYNSFGGKEALFLIALDGYIERVVKRRCDQYLNGSSVAVGVMAYMRGCFKDRYAQWGCLLVNSQVEWRSLPEQARQRIKGAAKSVRVSLERSIELGKSNGELKDTVDATAVARHLELLMQGLLARRRFEYRGEAMDASDPEYCATDEVEFLKIISGVLQPLQVNR